MMARHTRPPILDEIPKDRHTVIEASAGTGKTFAMEHLLVELLLTTDATIEQILVVTYTEKATWELRQRLRKKLEELVGPGTARAGEPAWEIDDEKKPKLRAALQQFDVASIHTIHGFCHRVMRNHAFAGGRPLEQQQVALRDVVESVFKDVLRRDVHVDERLCQFVAAAAEAGVEVSAMEATLVEAVERRVPLYPRFDPEALEAAIRVCAAVTPHPGAFEGQLRRPDGSKRGSLKGPLLFERVQYLHERARQFVADGDLARFLVDADEPAGYIAERLEKFDATILGPARELVEGCVPFTAAWVQLLMPHVQRRFDDEKRSQGLFDFDDMISVVRQALEGPQGDDVTAELRARYRFALIDEFQDTDEAQWAIFKRVFVDSSAANVLYLVGDPKQSIYSFRGADVRTYQRAVELVRSSGGGDVRLQHNHRSGARFIEACNIILDDDVESAVLRGSIRYTHPVQFGGRARALLAPDGTELHPVHVFHVRTEPSESRATQALLTARVAEEIDRLLRRPPTFVEGTERRELRPGDIHVLTHRTAEGHELGGHLARRGIPHAFYRQEGLFQTDEALDVLRVLEALADPLDHAKRCRAWLTRFFAVSLEDLEHARELPSGHPLVRRLFQWRGLVDEGRWSRVFSEMLEDSGLMRRLLFADESARALTNYQHVLELMLKEVAAGRRTPDELVARLRAFKDERALPDEQNGNVQRLETERNAVQLMTVHVSKGLEAPVVFLLGGLSQGMRGRVRLAYVGGQRAGLVGARKDLNALADDVRHEEEQRLLYVALTRAKVRLYAALVTTEKRPSVDTFGQFRGPHMQLNTRLWHLHDGQAFVPNGLFTFEPLTESPDSVAGKDDDAARLAGWTPSLPVEEAADRDFAQVRARHLGFVITSYSQMRRGQKKEVDWELSAQDEAALVDTVAPVPDADALPGGRLTGRFLHSVLEQVPLETTSEVRPVDNWSSLPPVRALFERELRRYQVERRHLPHAQRLVHRALTRPLSLGAEKRLPGVGAIPGQQREMEFIYPIPGDGPARPLGDPDGGWRIDKGFIKGFVDVILEHEGRCYFVDWKSDWLATWEQGALQNAVAGRYELQEQVYSLALLRMFGISSEKEYERRFGGILYLFIRGMESDDPSDGVYFRRPDWQTMRVWEARLAGVGGYGRSHGG